MREGWGIQLCSAVDSSAARADALHVDPAPDEVPLVDEAQPRAEAQLQAAANLRDEAGFGVQASIADAVPGNGALTRVEFPAPDEARSRVWGRFLPAAHFLRVLHSHAKLIPADTNLADEERCGFRLLLAECSRAEGTHSQRSADEARCSLDAGRC